MVSDITKLQPITEEDAWFAGERKLLSFTVYGEDEQVADISTWTFEWRLYDNSSSEEPLLAIDGSIVDGPTGQLSVTSTAADTLEIEPRTYYHQLWRIDSGAEAVVAYGPVVIQ